jgi:hypothetical protein
MNKHEELIELFKKECGYEIDEDDFSDDQFEEMRSAAVYWAIGKGLSPKDARAFARSVIYGVEE